MGSAQSVTDVANNLDTLFKLHPHKDGIRGLAPIVPSHPDIFLAYQVRELARALLELQIQVATQAKR